MVILSQGCGEFNNSMKFKLGQNVKIKYTGLPIWGIVVEYDKEREMYLIKMNYVEHYFDNISIWDIERVKKWAYNSLFWYKEDWLDEY